MKNPWERVVGRLLEESFTKANGRSLFNPALYHLTLTPVRLPMISTHTRLQCMIAN
jgi:hypothetical protein